MKSAHVKICLIMCALVMLVAAMGCGPKITAIYLDQEATSLNIGESLDLRASVFPENADASTLQWTSANTTVASVDESGHVTAVAPGTCKIICSSKQGITAVCSLEVKDNSVKEIILSANSLEMKVGESIQIEATVVPNDAPDKTLKWTSSNISVATVDDKGVVTAITDGETIITCTAVNGICSQCNVCVAQPTAFDLLNTFEKNFYDYLLDTILPSYYNPAAFRIRNIKESEGREEHTFLTIEFQSTNRLGGMTFSEASLSIDNADGLLVDMFMAIYPYKEVDGKIWLWITNLTDQEIDHSWQNLVDIDTNVIDYTKINAALEEHWENESMTK